MIPEIKISTPPISEPVSLNEIKDYLNITATDQDATIFLLLKAAREMVQRVSGFGMGSQTIKYQTDNVSEIQLQYPPVISVTSVKYINDLVTSAAMTEGYSSDWYKEGLDDITLHINVFNGQQLLVEYVAGYTPATLPAWARAAIYTLVENWMHNREQYLKMTPDVISICKMHKKNRWDI